MQLKAFAISVALAKVATVVSADVSASNYWESFTSQINPENVTIPSITQTTSYDVNAECTYYSPDTSLFTFNSSEWPTIWQTATSNGMSESEEFKSLYNSIDWTKAPNIQPRTLTADGGLDMSNYSSTEDPDCWWSASTCTTPKLSDVNPDIYRCPEPETWGLTYDDGPNCSHNAFYDYLTQQKLKATMFYIGSNVVDWPYGAMRGVKDGHHIAAHTWSHNYTTTLTNEQVLAEFYYTQKAIKLATGLTPRYWRPPYGDVDDRVRWIATQLNLTAVIWNLDTDDWAAGLTTTVQAVEQNYENFITMGTNGTFATSGNIVLSHEINNNTMSLELLERRDFKTHGYWKDLCTLLTIAAQGELDGPVKDEYKALHWPRLKRDKRAKATTRRARKDRYLLRKEMPETEAQDDRQAAIRKCSELNATNKITAKENRMKICKERNERVVSLLESNKTYRALHFTIAKLFADQLKKDMNQLQKNKIALEQGTLSGRHALGFNLSMAAKWAPSLCNSHDKHTFLATSIAEALFPPESYQQSEESREHYLNKVRDLYRKQYLVPLRKAMDLTEHYMAEGKWGKVDFGHIPAVCFEKSMPRFFSHDPEALMDYLDEVAKGTKQVSGETLAPNDLVYRAAKLDVPKSVEKIVQKVPGAITRLAEAEKNLVNGQWNTLIQGLRETSQLDVTKSNNKKIDLGECIAICDVSGSMLSGFDVPKKDCPYYAAIGLSLIIANLAKPPFNGGLITFSARPELVKIDTSLPFSDQVEKVMDIGAGYNTNLRAVFTDVLLPMAIKFNLKQEDMVKRLFIFTDMEFDGGTRRKNKFETTFDFIKQQYDEAGYELPEIVWWNLSKQDTCNGKNLNAPVTKHQEKTSLLSGFSASMVKTFLDGDVDIEEEKDQDEEDEKDEEDKERNAKSNKKEDDPLSFAKKAVYHESFNGLIVID